MTEPGSVLRDRAQIERAFTALGDRLVRRGVVADVFIVGGAAMALAYDATRVTRDVDSLFVPHGVVLEEARNVAHDLGLPAWRLNEQASVYISGKDDPDRRRVFDHPGLRVLRELSFRITAGATPPPGLSRHLGGLIAPTWLRLVRTSRRLGCFNGVIAAVEFVLASLEAGNRVSRRLTVVQRVGTCAGMAGKSGPVETVLAVLCGMAEGWMNIDWPAIPGPPEYRPDRVVRAFQALLHPTAEDWSDAGTMMRFAVGNDHGGTIYPAAVEATRAMLDLIAAYPGEPRTVALCVLLDWWSGFDPEPGYEQYDTAETGRVGLISAMRDTVLNGREVLQQAATDTRDPRSTRLATQLWTCAQAGWGYAVEDDGSLHHRFDD